MPHTSDHRVGETTGTISSILFRLPRGTIMKSVILSAACALFVLGGVPLHALAGETQSAKIDDLT